MENRNRLQEMFLCNNYKLIDHYMFHIKEVTMFLPNNMEEMFLL